MWDRVFTSQKVSVTRVWVLEILRSGVLHFFFPLSYTCMRSDGVRCDECLEPESCWNKIASAQEEGGVFTSIIIRTSLPLIIKGQKFTMCCKDCLIFSIRFLSRDQLSHEVGLDWIIGGSGERGNVRKLLLGLSLLISQKAKESP